MKILVVDDEELARERMLRLLSRLRPEAECLQAGNGEQALERVREHKPDLLLLDIRMPGIDGIEVAARLSEMASPPAVVFCTAYDQYALDALRHQAVAYLVKPVREEELANALDSAGRVNRLQLASLRDREAAESSGRTHISSQGHRGLETMAVAQVRCFVAEQKYVTAYGDGRELLIPDPLKDLETEFGERFIRVHRNALVAVEHILGLQRRTDGSWLVELEGVDISPAVSRRHLALVKQRLRGN